jgi:hypothetical protein
MYLAGLMADEGKMTREELSRWVSKAYWYLLSETTVAGVAAESRFGLEMARKWIRSEAETTAAAGWATYSGVVAIRDNEELDLTEISALLDEVVDSKNRVRYAMNGFVISVGAYIPELHEKARSAAARIGKVHVDMGGTACKVPYGPGYIEKIAVKGRVGKKRKQVRC